MKLFILVVLTLIGTSLLDQVRPIAPEQYPLSRFKQSSIPKQLASSLASPAAVIDTFKAAPVVVTTSAPTAVQSAPTGNKETWMSQAGIPQRDWQYVDYIVSHESGWNPNAYNSSSGSCSLVQALPCSKIIGDWHNPVSALKWQLGYVTERYGGYAQAFSFWKSNNWY